MRRSFAICVHTRNGNLDNMHGIQGAKIALLIDFDNVILGVEDPGFDVELVVNALRARGIVVMGRAYGDWYRHHRHRRKLMEQGIELVETPVFGPIIKNSADIRIVLDGIDVALAHSHIDTFCLVSGDSDFLPLIKRLQLLGKNVIVIAGKKFTSELVRRNCNEYIAYENLFAESIGATDDVSTLDGACQLLQRAIDTLLERGMDARSSTVKQMMLQMNPAFSERTFGCSQFKQFLDKATRTGVVKLGDRDAHTGEYAVLLMENGAVVEAPEKSAPREDTSRRRGRERAPREFKTEPASTRVEAPRDAETPRENTAPESAAPLAIEDELLAESGTAFSTGEKAQTRGTLRRGRLKFSAKSGVSAAAPVASESPESAPKNAAAKSENAAPAESAPAEAEAPREYSQEAKSETALEAATTEVETAATPDAEGESAAPKKRTTRGGRRRKPKSENGDDAASAEKPAANESATELDGAATSLQDLKEATAIVPEAKAPKSEVAASERSDEPAAPKSNATADAEEKPAPKKRATRGGRRKKPAAEKAAGDAAAGESAE